MEEILMPVIVISAVGIIAGLMLTVASKYMAVAVDERVSHVRDVLPGSNCGGCGFAGCDVYAEKVVSGEAKPNLCLPGGHTAVLAIAGALGIDAEAVTPSVAIVKCSGTCHKTDYAIDYQGPPTCVSCNFLYKGRGQCSYSCLGFGDCVNVCTFSAIYMVNGVPVVDKQKCTGCGMCARACPKALIDTIPADKYFYVGCSSKDKGGVVRKLCSAGCIGCMKCVKACEQGAITTENYLAHIDPKKCINCGNCAEECPVSVIKDRN